MKVYAVRLYFAHGVEYTSVEAATTKEALLKVAEHHEINQAYSVEISFLR